MTDGTVKMKQIMEQLLVIHDRLIRFAKDKTQAITDGDAEAVRLIIGEETALIARLETLNKEIERLTQGDLLQTEQDQRMTFATWLETMISKKEQAEWLELQQQLSDRIRTLKLANSLNQDLLRQSLQWVRISMSLLNPQPQSPTYRNPNGRGSQRTSFSGRIDSRA